MTLLRGVEEAATMAGFGVHIWGTLLLKSLTDQCNYMGTQLLASNSQLDLNLARDVKVNKKGFYKYMGDKRNAG